MMLHLRLSGSSEHLRMKFASTLLVIPRDGKTYCPLVTARMSARPLSMLHHSCQTV